MNDVRLAGTAIRLAYRELIGVHDPARPWLDSGVADARFVEGDEAGGAVVRGADDLGELHEIIDDLFGVGAFPRPRAVVGETRRAKLAIVHPAVVVPFLDVLRPHLEGRGPAFWTWKSAREAMARRLQQTDAVTLAATRRSVPMVR